MSIRFHLVEPGMSLWQRGGYMYGRRPWFEVRILEKHESHCIVSSNNNPPRRMRKIDVEKLYRTKTAEGE